MNELCPSFVYIIPIDSILPNIDSINQSQLLLALYYTIADLGLIYQVIYYRRHPVVVDVTAATPIKESTPLLSSVFSSISYSTTSPAPHATASPMRRRLLHAFALALITCLAGVALFWGIRHFSEISSPCNPDDNITSPPETSPVSPSPPSSDRDIQVVPQIFGWISALLYVGSRIPQIVKNYRNKSTDGLSLAMFGFSVLGNTTFCLVGNWVYRRFGVGVVVDALCGGEIIAFLRGRYLLSRFIQSIFLRSIEPHFLLINLPWLFGSGGTLIFDFTVSPFFFFFLSSS